MKPNNWVINTLSLEDLSVKLEWCQNNLEIIDGQLNRQELHGDRFCNAKDDKKWLEGQIKSLQHWLDTL